MKFIHTADVHFDCPLKSEYDENLKKLLYDNQKRVFEEILELAETEKCDFVLISGDLFHNEQADFAVYNSVYEMLEKASVPVYIAPGNHDPYTEKSCYVKYGMPKNVHIFRNETEIIEKEDYDIYGIGLSAPHIHTGLLKGFKVENPHKKSVMIMHGEVKADSFYNPITTKEIEESGLSYLALGHIHLPAEGRAGDTVYAYSGTPQPMSFQDSEKGYINIVEIDNRVKIERKEISLHEFASLEADITLCRNEEEIAALAGNPEKGIILELTLTGEAEESSFDWELLKSILTERFLYVNINLACKKSMDFNLLKNEKSVRGEFVRITLEKLKDYNSDFVRRVINEGLSRL